MHAKEAVRLPRNRGGPTSNTRICAMMKGSGAFSHSSHQRVVSIRLQSLLLVAVGGGVAGLVTLLLVRSSAGRAANNSLMVATLILAGLGVALLAIGQVRRPLLAVLAFTFPLHLDAYFGFFSLGAAGSPVAALLRLTANDVVLVLLLGLLLLQAARNGGLDRSVDGGLRGQSPGSSASAPSRSMRDGGVALGRVLVPALLFLTLGVVSIGTSQEPRLAVYQTVELGKGLLLFLYIALSVKDRQDLTWVLGGLMAAVLFQGALGLYQAIMERPLGLALLGERVYVRHQLLEGQVTIRPTGTLWHTNHLSMYLGMVLLPLGALLLLPSMARPIAKGGPSTPTESQSSSRLPVTRGRKGGLRIEARLLVTAVVLVGMVTLLYTLSRGAWLGVIAGAGVLVAYGLQKRSISPAHVVLLVVVLLLAVLAFNAATDNAIFQRLFGDDLGSAQSRLPSMTGALAIIADYPLLGSGLNNYRNTIKIYDRTGEFTESGVLPIVHNLFLLIAAETGLLGLGAFIWLLAALAWRGLRFLSTCPLNVETVVVAGLLAAGIHTILHNLVDFGLLGDLQLMYQFWFLAGLLVALTRPAAALWDGAAHARV